MERWEQVLQFWFDGDGKDRSDRWFGRDPALDAEIRERFGRDLEQAGDGRLDDWAATARGRLALIIVLDQLSRNIHRDHKAAYAQDAKAQALCVEGIERGLDRRLSILERWFFYMPLMHAENMELQERSVHCFRQLLEDAPEDLKETCKGVLGHAREHRDTIEQFGRFPYRNEVLGRTSSVQELRYLEARAGR